MFGKVIIRNDSDYVINCDEQGRGGYNVVPLSVDPLNKYSLDDVRAYTIAHPEDVLDMEAIELAKLPARVRAKRDSLIVDVEWRVQRHESELRQGKTATEDIEPLDDYIQTLRDIPSQEGFPNNITWPSKP